jgi:hypothetical protein
MVDYNVLWEKRNGERNGNCVKEQNCGKGRDYGRNKE